MNSALNNFDENLKHVKNLGNLHSVLGRKTTLALDLSDILRAELVFCVSAFDHYIHELIELGIIEIYNGTRQPTDAFNNFSVTLGSFWQNHSVLSNHEWLQEEVRVKHSYKSFQRSESISKVLKLISGKKIWVEVGTMLHVDPGDIKARLDLIVDRRNKIAHESDIDPTNGTRWPINEQLIDEALFFINLIGQTLYVVLN